MLEASTPDGDTSDGFARGVDDCIEQHRSLADQPGIAERAATDA
jgi:hypothetical protein